MGVSSEEKDEISTYQLKYVAKIWYEQWKSERLVEAGPIDCEVFKEEFLDMFFPIELREWNMQEFINLRQGGINVTEYSLKFTQLSKYAPTMVEE